MIAKGNTMTSTTDALAQAGMSGAQAEYKSEIFRMLAQAHADMATSAPRSYFIPGRIEVLGKHVDYAGGRSLTCATEQGFCMVASPRNDWRVRLIEPTRRLEASFPLDPELEPWANDWTNYPMNVCRRIARNFPRSLPAKLRGCDIAFTSDLPQAAGLSSSSALVVGAFTAIAEINNLQQHPAYTSAITSDLDLAGYLGAVENGLGYGPLEGDRGVGTLGGSQDHTAILCAKANTLSCFTYRPVQLESRITLPGNHVFVIGVSGVHAAKAGNAKDQYNRASELASEAAALWRNKTGRDDIHLAAAANSSPDAPEQLRTLLNTATSNLRQRADQFLDETYNIVPNACHALTDGDLKTFGELTDRSQSGAENKLGNQVPQTMFLAKQARELGAVAASAFGAGFGGSVWAMIHEDCAEDFSASWSRSYQEAFPNQAHDASFVTTRAGPPAMRVG